MFLMTNENFEMIYGKCFQRSEVRSQKSEVRNQKSEIRDQAAPDL
jgi:hypothetical protein